MKYLAIIITYLVTLMPNTHIYAATLQDNEIAKAFSSRQGCFLLYNLTKDRYEVNYGGSVCDTRVSPASTFKIPNSLIDLD
jgi:beta-lactamase class D